MNTGCSATIDQQVMHTFVSISSLSYTGLVVYLLIGIVQLCPMFVAPSFVLFLSGALQKLRMADALYDAGR